MTLSHPTSAVITPGSLAVYTCSSANVVEVKWFLNGTRVETHNIPGIIIRQTESASLLVFTITDVVVQYNGTSIQCVAKFDSGCPPSASQQITLDIQSEFSNCECGNLTNLLSKGVIKENSQNGICFMQS